MTPTPGRGPLVGLAAALVVLIGGVAAAFSKDGPTTARSDPNIVSSSLPRLATTSTTVTASTFATVPATSLPASATTVRPAVPSPEAAANGLWAAYSSANRNAASRFATAAVADALFTNEYSGERGSFEGCRKRGEGAFDCEYRQQSARYVMTAEADDSRSYRIVVISIERAVTTTTDSFSS